MDCGQSFWLTKFASFSDMQIKYFGMFGRLSNRANREILDAI